jgi:hypothetical protein
LAGKPQKSATFGEQPPGCSPGISAQGEGVVLTKSDRAASIAFKLRLRASL